FIPPTRRWPTPRRSCDRSSDSAARLSLCGWPSRAASPEIAPPAPESDLMTMQTVSLNKSYGGTQGVYKHASRETGTDMTFSVYVPPHQGDRKLPVVWY